MTVSTVYSHPKFKELLLYVAEESVDDPKFGKTKLNKILFYIDFLTYGILGKPVTGATYQRRPYGPVPKEITQARNDLIASGDADITHTEHFGLPQQRLVAKRPPNLSLFSNEEKRLIDGIIGALRCKNGSEASELSHREPGWRLAREGETIPYPAVFLSARLLTSEDIVRGQEVFQILRGEAA